MVSHGSEFQSSAVVLAVQTGEGAKLSSVVGCGTTITRFCYLCGVTAGAGSPRQPAVVLSCSDEGQKRMLQCCTDDGLEPDTVVVFKDVRVLTPAAVKKAAYTLDGKFPVAYEFTRYSSLSVMGAQVPRYVVDEVRLVKVALAVSWHLWMLAHPRINAPCLVVVMGATLGL
jgi:hypothetical protein